MHRPDEQQQQQFDARTEDFSSGSSRYNNQDEEDCAQARDTRKGDKFEGGPVPLLTMTRLSKY